MKQTRCGYIALIGRPNVGKSTLLNQLLDKKISITSRKPQTTRHQIIGVHTQDHIQSIFVDTPGIHRKTPRKMNQVMNRAAYSTIHDVDVICFILESLVFNKEDEWVLKKLVAEKLEKTPVVLLINKIDKIKDRALLLPFINVLKDKSDFSEIIPISAKLGKNTACFMAQIGGALPEGPHFFPADQVTNRCDEFLASEIIREKLTRQLGKELPYVLGVEIERFEFKSPKKEMRHIHAVIWVEREGQKRIIIGAKGETLKSIGTQARHDMERLLGHQVHLNLWVKVKAGWSSSDTSLKQLGYL